MLLKKLTLVDFRSHIKKELIFTNKLTIIAGPNASGKTNILESIFLIATGKSFRAEKDTEMINDKKEIGRVLAEIQREDGKKELEVILTRGIFRQKRSFTKRYLINGIPRRMTDFVGNLKVCLFWPEDLELVTDSPSIRRRYLDFVLTQTDKKYRRNLYLYEKGLRARNKILEKIKEGRAKRDELEFWNHLLIENGNFITKERQNYIEFLNHRSTLIENHVFQIFYDKSIISEERLKQYADEEVNATTTLVGPHRDDMEFKIKKPASGIERDLSLYGSRGEQRLCVLWLKLGELEFIKEKKSDDNPILLLDDIFSEFDLRFRRLIFNYIGQEQTIITTTDTDLIEEKLKRGAHIIHLNNASSE